MVYGTISIVNGIVLTREQVLSYLDLPEDEKERKELLDELIGQEIVDKFYDDVLEGTEKGLRGEAGLRLFTFPCCSKNNGEIFVLGYEVHTIYRKYVTCFDCKQCTVCDKCIGETSHGSYNVDAIFEGLVEIPEEKLCRRCNSDRVENGRCRFCNSNEKGKWVSWRHDHLVSVSKKILKIKAQPKYYYMLDDCLSCT